MKTRTQPLGPRATKCACRNIIGLIKDGDHFWCRACLLAEKNRLKKINTELLAALRNVPEMNDVAPGIAMPMINWRAKYDTTIANARKDAE